MLTEDQQKQLERSFTDHLKQRAQQPTLPQGQTLPPGQPPPPGAQAGLGPGTLVLLVSEGPAILQFLLAELRKFGVQV